MRPRDALNRLDRWQNAFWFKVTASILVAAVAVFLVGRHFVDAQAQRRQSQFRAVENPEAAAAAARPLPPDATDAQRAEAAAAEARRTELRISAELTVKALNRMLEARTDPTAFAVGAAAVLGLALGVIWIGQALSVFTILLLLGLVAFPLVLYGSPFWRDLGKFIAAVGSLSLAFVILMQLLRLLLSGASPVFAIARNVVNEAVRIKVSLVFIVLLLFALAGLPGMLDDSTPLRYRVQSFLQYGTGGSFWIIAVLVVFLAVSSVTFEQRDRVIWQTMTKPVAAWQYILGKWLGAVGVAAVLLSVSATGVFLFTEYLRGQRAVGEVQPFVPADRSGETLITEDRLVLESQILTARVSVRPVLPDLDQQVIDQTIAVRVQRAKDSDPNFQDSNAARAKLLEEFLNERRTQFFAIGGGETKKFTFAGLGDARSRGVPLTLRYKVDVGANDPKVIHRFSYRLAGDSAATVVQVPLGQTLTADISPGAIDSAGNLEITVVNGDANASTEGGSDWANEATMSFPPEGFEVSYPVSSYHANFVRVTFVLWLKLAFLAMVGVCASTFLSFAVAALLSFGTFLIAESSRFLFTSLEYYASTDDKGNIDVFKVLVRAIAVPISRIFKYYSDLRPTSRLVDGRLLPWVGSFDSGDAAGQGVLVWMLRTLTESGVLQAVLILGLVTALLYLVAVGIFRRRELAMYSGN